MALAVGSRLGPYEIVSALGAGGMGEVYRARDTRLDRTVAIKVLPSHLALDHERRARFEREARAVSALNHPHICTLYDIGRQDGVDYLVLEYLEGETLADRLSKGALPLPLALGIGASVADALDKAHRAGIVHRDVKPGNVVLTKSGAKLLDFGVARVEEPPRLPAGDTSSMPTKGKPLTEEGSLIGTFQYMAPEQLEGKNVDERTDIFALGSVLYEMVTGRRAFEGKSSASLIGAILKDEPQPMAAIQSMAPPALDRVVRRCLAKDPDERWQSASDLAAELRWIAEEGSRTYATVAEASRRLPFARLAPWLLAAAATFVVAWALWLRSSPDAGPLQVQELDVSFPADIEPVPYLDNGFALSPDGRMVAMIGVKNGARLLFVRPLESAEVLEITESGGLSGATFSPDSKKIALVGGNAQVTSLSLVDRQRTVLASNADQVGGVAWGAAGIAFARNGALWIAPTGGGEPRSLTALDAARHEVLHREPLFLPGGRAILFSSLTTEPGTERIEAVSVDGGARRVVVERATTPLRSPTGHLLFARDGAVLATDFDEEAVRVRGVATPVLPQGLVGTSRSGALGLRLAANGTLLFMPEDFHAVRLVSVARDGSALTLDLPRGRYHTPQHSPDGHRVMVGSDFNHLEALNMERGTRAPLTTATPGTGFCVWNRDGSRIVYRRFNSPLWMSADGSGQEGEVKGGLTNDFPSGPGPDPDSVLVTRLQPETSSDVFLLSLSGAFAPRPLLSSRAYEGGAQLSPDGRWLAYASNESGQFEIHVRRFPELDRQWQVSEGGGTQPRWSVTDREIYYRGGPTLTAVPFDGRAEEPVMGKPQALFRDEYDLGQGITIANYDVTPEGRFLMLRRDAQGGHLRIILNWTEELKRELAKAAR
jgi:Tol biopolymer transport system component